MADIIDYDDERTEYDWMRRSEELDRIRDALWKCRWPAAASAADGEDIRFINRMVRV